MNRHVPRTDIHPFCHRPINLLVANSLIANLSRDAMIRWVLLLSSSARISQVSDKIGEKGKNYLPVQKGKRERSQQVHWSSIKGLKCRFIQLVRTSSSTCLIDLHSVNTWSSSKTLGAVNLIQKVSRKWRRESSSNSCVKTRSSRRRSKWRICWSNAFTYRKVTSSQDVALFPTVSSRRYSGNRFCSLAWRMLWP